MLKRLAMAVRDHLNLNAIESDIGEIKNSLNQELRQMEDQELRAGAVRANQQQQLESIIRELGAEIEAERSRRDAIELKLAGSIAELTIEVRRLCDVVDEQRRSVVSRQYDNDQ